MLFALRRCLTARQLLLTSKCLQPRNVGIYPLRRSAAIAGERQRRCFAALQHLLLVESWRCAACRRLCSSACFLQVCASTHLHLPSAPDARQDAALITHCCAGRLIGTGPVQAQFRQGMAYSSDASGAVVAYVTCDSVLILLIQISLTSLELPKRFLAGFQTPPQGRSWHMYCWRRSSWLASTSFQVSITGSVALQDHCSSASTGRVAFATCQCNTC